MTTSVRARHVGPASPAGTVAPVARRLRDGLGREVVVFAAIGIASTAAYGLIYLLLRTMVEPAAANAAALVVTAVGNTAANRRLTFGVGARRSMVRDQAIGLAALGVALAITTACVSLLGALVPTAGRHLELAVLVAANALATVARFVLLRTLIGGRRAPSWPAIQPAPAENRSPR